MDDFEFVAEQFVEYLEPAVALLFGLLKEAVECETKMTVLYVMSFIIEKMSMSMRIDVQSLVQYLPLLWEESREHNMLRCAIISTLVRVCGMCVRLLCNISYHFFAFFAPTVADNKSLVRNTLVGTDRGIYLSDHRDEHERERSLARVSAGGRVGAVGCGGALQPHDESGVA